MNFTEHSVIFLVFSQNNKYIIWYLLITQQMSIRIKEEINIIILDQHFAEHAYQTHTFFPDAPSPLSPLSG